MTWTERRISNGIGLLVVAAAAGAVGYANHRAHGGPAPVPPRARFVASHSPGTTRRELQATIAAARAALYWTVQRALA